jgi:hypothetical protein
MTKGNRYVNISNPFAWMILRQNETLMTASPAG